MNCSACTYYNEYSQNSCIICNTPLIHNEKVENKGNLDFKKWLTQRGLISILSKVDKSIIEESTELPNILDTSSKITRKQAIKLAYEIGLYKTEQKVNISTVNLKEKILEDRLIIQEQDLRAEILLLQDKLNEYENKIKDYELKENLLKFSDKMKESRIEEEVSKELSKEERRKLIAESWAKK